jgi:hypothetical protein
MRYLNKSCLATIYDWDVDNYFGRRIVVIIQSPYFKVGHDLKSDTFV